MLLIALLSLVFGTIVDSHRKKQVMLASTFITLVTYLLAGSLYVIFPTNELVNWQTAAFWLFSLIILCGAVVENMRNIALSTTVTLLVDKENHARANGLVGTVQGLAFVVTSVFSGLAIGFLGMGWTLVIAIVLTAIACVHLLFISIPEDKIIHDPALKGKKIDFKGSMLAIHAVPGLMGLILFTTFNNFIGGVFMSLVDPYGLTLFSVEIWGIVLGITSTGFIVGGILVAKKGLGKRPLRTLLFVNIAMAIVGMVFAIREVWWLYTLGNFVYMVLFPIIEASEQTIIQRVVPFKRQGRVFGFAQSIEAAAAPITAFLVGPLAQFLVIPYMNEGGGEKRLEWLLGNGNARGIALIFLITGLIMLFITSLAFFTKTYRRLSNYYAKS